MTFADLMTLLMCFFVLLLAFSEMDVLKFKQLSGSVREAFGVQAEIEANTIPKGTSIIAQEFSPGKPEPTPINEVRQMTMDNNKTTLEFVDPDMIDQDKVERRLEAENDARMLREALKKEIEAGQVAVRSDGSRVIIHVLEKGAFPSGYAEVETNFVPVLEKIAGLVVSMKGSIRVAGHTDNVPISNSRFRSNWELSSARAVSVAHVLLDNADLDPVRLLVTGHADTQPRGRNDTPANRAQNRRVDISIVRGKEDQYATLGDDGEVISAPEPATEPARDSAGGAPPTHDDGPASKTQSGAARPATPVSAADETGKRT